MLICSGFYPHAHYLGKDVQSIAKFPDGTERELIHIKDWDINWQSVYQYKQPVFSARRNNRFDALDV